MGVSNSPEPRYCSLCRQEVTDWKAHIHSRVHLTNIVACPDAIRLKEYLANMQRPRIE